MRRRRLTAVLLASAFALPAAAPAALADPDFGPGNSSKGPNDGGAKCHPPGQTVKWRGVQPVHSRRGGTDAPNLAPRLSTFPPVGGSPRSRTQLGSTVSEGRVTPYSPVPRWGPEGKRGLALPRGG